ncbi:NADH-quinone oxidoreductase subunit 5 family protein [Ekhidna lutea]|uniref:NADH-quinone oxidoreductase subunit 5 family protein n=1 Tax=Ekhidna lutea TaxID=447679 RepID=UPI0015C67AE9|nr:NADH-quinone oxidoreductase subunit L [Ekhidna lutea]
MNEVLIISLLFLPLAGGVFGMLFKNTSYSIGGIGLSFAASLLVIINSIEFNTAIQWLPDYSLGIKLDSTAAILICLVTLISLLVHTFSLEYMREDDGKHRYFAKLGLFTFSMIGLLLADHLILLFVFWELVGLTSYLLIGFWYKKDGIPASARLSFMVNRIADVALLAGILMINNSGSLNISELSGTWLFLPSILVAIGAFGKSAQLPFSGWLTKAMVGPTPVSALIHAATMVAAGVYLLFRVAPFMHESTLIIVALTGTFTALYGGLCALFQHDIKKVLAYSTISQLGYMVMGIGVGAGSASIFHLFTHAFFKAGLFLGAGAIIHYLHQVTKADAQDMRNMGGLKKALPWTYSTFLVCALALTGIPFFSGFMSKEGIIIAGWEWAEQIGAWAYIVPDVGLITAFLTALYVGRMVLLVFYSENRLEEKIVAFSENLSLKVPLIVLALGSFWFVFDWNPFAHESRLSGYWSSTPSHSSDSISLIVMILSTLLAISGLVLAYSFFKPGSNYEQSFSKLEVGKFKLAFNGFYLVALYQSIGRGFSRFSQFTFAVDQMVVDGFIHFVGVGSVVISKVIALIDRFMVDGPVNLCGHISAFVGKRVAGLSSRDIQTQLAWLLAGVILILSWILFF